MVQSIKRIKNHRRRRTTLGPTAVYHRCGAPSTNSRVYIYIAPTVLRLPTGRRLSSKFGVFTYSTACFSPVHARNKLRGDRTTAIAAADSCCRKAIW